MRRITPQGIRSIVYGIESENRVGTIAGQINEGHFDGKIYFLGIQNFCVPIIY